jgi:murein hydrolase activator
MQKLFSTFLAFALMFTCAQAQPPQNKEEINRKRQELQREMEKVKEDIKLTQQTKKETLGTLAVIENKIDVRSRYVDNINQEIDVIENDMSRSYREIKKLREELDTLRMQYAKSIVYAYKNRSNYDFLNFLFSASSFNDALKRVAYLRSYRQYREQQAGRIASTQDLLKGKVNGLNVAKTEKSVVLGTQARVLNELEEDKKEKDNMVARLKSREKELSAQLGKKKKQDVQLKTALLALIRKEEAEARRIAKAKADEETRKRLADEKAARLAKAKNDAAKPPGAPPAAPEVTPAPAPVAANRATKKNREASVFEATPQATALSMKFEDNRGSLPWPVDQGVISMGFGPTKYQGTNINFDNPGITIETQVGATVKAVFDGEVSSVLNLDNGQAVVVRHGKYSTTYSVLSSVTVGKGQQVKAGQAIGRAGNNDDGVGEVNLWLMNGDNLVNPKPWLKGR